ncbi:MAG: type IV pilus assembly protein PilM [Candidatus Magasanikbacteria bacterium]|nr:type IV pilus assembly protein PilM [Candidatus Magasanikbacteria bacterium]
MFGKPPSFLGVDFGAFGVKVVELKKVKNRPVLHTYGYTAAPTDIHALARLARPGGAKAEGESPAAAAAPGAAAVLPTATAALAQAEERYGRELREVCRQAQVLTKTAVASLPVTAVFHALLTIPLGDPKNRRAQIEAEAEKLLPYPAAEATLDYQVLPPGKAENADKTEQVLLNAVPRELVTFYTRVFAAAGLKLAALETEAVALVRSLVGRDEAVVLLLDLGAERTNFFMVEGGVPVTHQSVELGGRQIAARLESVLGIKGEAVEQLRRDLFVGGANLPAGLNRSKFIELLAPVLQPLVKEIEYGMVLYRRESGAAGRAPEKIILTGGAAELPGLSEYLAEQFRLKCYLGDPWGRVIYQEGLKPILDDLGPRLAVAIGLALRGVV